VLVSLVFLRLEVGKVAKNENTLTYTLEIHDGLYTRATRFNYRKLYGTVLTLH
jgi:hypothetical protein